MISSINSLFTIHTLRASWMSIALIVSFFLNFLYTTYLGRTLSFTDFGVITFIGSIWLIVVVFLNSLSLTLSHSIITKKHESEDEAEGFFQETRKRGFIISFLLSIVWIASSFFISSIFSLNSTTTVMLLTPLFIFGFLTAMNRGYFTAEYKFRIVGITLIVEALTKLLFAVFFVQIGYFSYVFLSIPLSIIGAFVVTQVVLPHMKENGTEKKFRFPKHFYFASVMSVLSTTLLFTFDVILAKLFLTSEVAGQYAFLSTIGKMIYFSGSILNTVMVPYVVSKFGKNQDSSGVFYKFLLVSSVGIISTFILFGPFGTFFLPFLFGTKVTTVSHYLIPYALAMSFFTFANMFVVYNLLVKKYIFPFSALFFSLLMIIGITLFHNGISAFVNVFLVLSVFSLGLILMLHFNSRLRSGLETKLAFLNEVYE